jgi:hypothetical protein
VRHGTLQVVDDVKRLSQLIEGHYAALAPRPTRQFGPTVLSTRTNEKLAAIAVAMLLWFLLVYRAQVVSESFKVAVGSSPPSADLRLTEISPSAIEIQVEGPRRSLRHLRTSDLAIQLPANEDRAGFQMLRVSERLFDLPDGVRIIDIRPRQVLGRLEAIPSSSVGP